MKLNFCVACGRKSDLHNHHLIPRSKGGTDRPKNLITLCYNCHRNLHGLIGNWGDHSELTRAGMAKKKALGGKYCGQVYGWDEVDGRFIKNKDEHRVIRLIVKLKETLSYREICGELDRRGIPPRVGEKWRYSSVYRIYQRSS